MTSGSTRIGAPNSDPSGGKAELHPGKSATSSSPKASRRRRRPWQLGARRRDRRRCSRQIQRDRRASFPRDELTSANSEAHCLTQVDGISNRCSPWAHFGLILSMETRVLLRRSTDQESLPRLMYRKLAAPTFDLDEGSGHGRRMGKRVRGRDDRADQAIRQADRGRSRRSARTARLGLRLSGTERSRQDDDDPDAAWSHSSRRRRDRLLGRAVPRSAPRRS